MLSDGGSKISWDDVRRKYESANVSRGNESERVTITQVNTLLGTRYLSIDDIPRGVMRKLLIALVHVIIVHVTRTVNDR